MSDVPTRYTFDRVVRLTLSVAGVVGLFLLLRYLSDVLLPFVAAAVLAYLINPIVNAFERKLNRRPLAVAIVLVGVVVAGLAMSVIVAVFTIRQYENFSQTLSTLRAELHADGAIESVPSGEQGTVVPSTSGSEDAPGAGTAQATPDGDATEAGSSLGLRESYDAWTQYRATAESTPRLERLRTFRSALEGTVAGQLIEQVVGFDGYGKIAVDVLKQVFRGGWTVLTAGLNLILGMTALIVVLLYLVFLLLDYPHYVASAREFLPPAYRQAVLEFTGEFERAMRRYFRAQACVASITGVLFMIGFSIMGLPLAVPLGAFIGLLNMVPYLQVVALVPAALLAILRAVGQDSSMIASLGWVVLVFGVVQLIQDGLLTPRIMAGATGLRPVAIMLGVFIWGKLLGFLGLLLAIPLTCLGIAYYRRLVLKHFSDSAECSPSRELEGTG